MEALSTITSELGGTSVTGVDVDFDDDAACSVSGNKFTIEFLQDFGDLPLLVADSSNLKMSIATSSAKITVSTTTEGLCVCMGEGPCLAGAPGVTNP